MITRGHAFRFLCSALICLPLPAAASEELQVFEKHIRPVLAERCYECHGEKKQKGGLRLDNAAAVLKGGDSGSVLVPGKPDESLLIKAISWSDPDLQMPPKNKLSDAQIAALKEWVKIGAPDPRTNSARTLITKTTAEAKDHWAYQPPKKSAPPSVANHDWTRSDVDRFILAKIESAGQTPAPDADRATLLRRAYFDLIGIPPTPEQLTAFVNDSSANAFARVVDGLLASPQFGERWGRHWLDVARYGESVTLRGLVFKEAWRYRDYVIEAFNSDMPYDEFIREQIAGDLLSSANLVERRRRIIATTFLALGNTNLEEQDKAQLRMDIVDEQLDTIGKAFLAQTIGCARCHDHKFDPIPTRDYYAMAGILRSTRTVTNANVSGWIERALPVEAGQEELYRNHETQLAALRNKIKTAKDLAKASAGRTGEPSKVGQSAPAIIAATNLPGVVADSSQAKAVGAWKLSQFSKRFVGDGYLHDDAKDKGAKTLTFIPELKKPGRYEVRFAYVHSPSRATNVPLTVFHADGETTVVINEQEAPVLDGRFVSLGQFRFEANGFGYVLVANEGTMGHVTADAVQFLPAEEVEVASRREGDAPRAAERHASAGEIKTLEAELKKLIESGPKRALAMSVEEASDVGDTHIHVRGSVHNLGAKVPRGFLQVATRGDAPVIPEKQSGRLEFADWIVSPGNPLTARVMANRVWHWLMGAGLVRTPDNFGTTGEAPSHPELLDHLALSFQEQGWSVKKLVREIMLSRVYQLATGPVSSDPENRLHARANRRRLDAECIRDAMLFVSGELNLDAGGSTIKPGTSADYGYQFSEPRRSVYVPVFRNALPEILEVFDFANPSSVVGARNVSTVAPQALFLMNHPFVHQQAMLAAQRILRDASTESARTELIYARALGRKPSAGESAVARKALQGQGTELEAWTRIVHAVFASADFRYVN